MRNITSVFMLALVATATLFVVASCDRTETNTTPAGSGGSATTSQAPAEPKTATQPIIPITQMKDWCPEHGMPESVCVQCNPSLAAGFKAKGDWDEAHNVPKSQCFQCDPSLKDKFAAAYKEKYGSAPPIDGTGESKQEAH